MLKALNPKDSSVLIVEDNPDDALIAARALQTFGIRKVYAAGTAEEALEFLQSETCDVILVDYLLPGMSGVGFVEEVRRAYPHVVSIMVTGAQDERVAADSLKAGAFDYVAKDQLLTSSIIRTLQAALRSQISSSEEERRETLGGTAGLLGIAREEAQWLLASFPSRATLRETAAGEGALQDVLEEFVRYLRLAFEAFPETAQRDEEALLRMFLERGSSPVQVLATYRAAVGALLHEQITAPFSPALCLVRLFANLLEQYQRRQSLAAAQQEAA